MNIDELRKLGLRNGVEIQYLEEKMRNLVESDINPLSLMIKK